MRETSNNLQQQNSQQPKQFRGGEKKVMKKKIASAAIAASMIIPMAVPAFAATTTPSDVVGTPVQSAVEELTALGIINGYTDGTFKPENSITRAELAKIIVVATGNEASAKLMQNVAPTFKDVKANEWYTGYINVAAAKGFIQGYNGEYRPGDTVKFEEVAAILVRALGYKEANLGGQWPYNYIIAGQDAGLFGDLTVATGTSANRGVVAQMASNALNAWLVSYDKDGALIEPGTEGSKKLISKLGATEDATLLTDSVDDQDQIVLSTGPADVDDNFIVTGGESLTDLLGHTVTVLKKNGKVVSITDATSSSNIVTGKLTAAQADILDADTVLVTNSAGTKLTLNADADLHLYVNNTEVDSTNDDLAKDQNVVVILNNKKVQAVLAVNTLSNLVVDDVEEYDDYLLVNTKSGDSYQVNKNTIVTLNGKAAKASDLKENDIISVVANGDDADQAVTLTATRNSVTGDLDGHEEVVKGATHTHYYTVNGKDYKYVGAAASLDDSNVDSEYTFYLNANGEVAYFEAVNAADSSAFGVVYSVETGSFVVDGQAQATNKKVVYYSFADQKKVTAYTTAAKAGDLAEGTLTEIFFDEDGLVDFDGPNNNKTPKVLDIASTSETVSSVSASSLKTEEKGSYTLNSNTAYYFVKYGTDGKVSSVSAATADDLTKGDVVSVQQNKGTASYVLITENKDAAEDLAQVQGLFVGTSTKKVGDTTHFYVKLAVNGTVTSYEVTEALYDVLTDDTTGAEVNEVITLPAGSGVYDVATSPAVPVISSLAALNGVVVDRNNNQITDTNGTTTVTTDDVVYLVNSATQYYVIDADGNYSKSTLTKVQELSKKTADYDTVVVKTGETAGSSEYAGVVIVVAK
ncbi:S-layer homology domain-containing protein [Paenibacillus protaetiae]|nr:S-layer homology domain-containing protein [Paenibacillus protaetiae]